MQAGDESDSDEDNYYKGQNLMLDRLTDWFFEHPYNPSKMYDNLIGESRHVDYGQMITQYCVNLYEFLTRFDTHLRSGRFKGDSRFAGRKPFDRNTTVLRKYDTVGASRLPLAQMAAGRS